MDGPSVLTTGATGFIGSHLANDLVQKGRKIRCLVRPTSSRVGVDFLRGLGAELVYGDLTDRTSLGQAVKGVTTVFHLGGVGTLEMPEELCFKVNAIGTRNLLDACVDHGTIEKFIHVSTCGVMGDVKTRTC